MCVFLGLLYLGMGWTYGENFWALGQLGPPKNGGLFLATQYQIFNLELNF